MHEFECELASMVADQARYKPDKIDAVQGSLDDTQFSAVSRACEHGMSILRGLPGSGKTTTLQQIIESFCKAGMRGVVACPTGKAAKRADEIISKLALKGIDTPACMTAHRVLGFSNGKFEHSKSNKLDVDYVVLDEFSMAGMSLSHALFSAIDPTKTRVVLCGDNNQLPSVDPGAVFRDIIKSGAVCDTYLTRIYRQGENSGIVHNAERVLRGKTISQHDQDGRKYNDIFVVRKASEEDSHAYVCELECERLPEKRGFDGTKDIQVISPGKNGEVGTKSLNASLRDRLNPGAGVGYYKFKTGDKVINRKNNYDLGIVNGDVGVVTECGTSGMVVDFGQGAGKDGTGIVKVTGEAGSNVHLAYAFTVHSSQGSEFKCCILVIHKSHYKLLDRNLLYTGMTRARELVVIVGDQEAIDRCISNNSADNRMTGLSRRISCIAK